MALSHIIHRGRAKHELMFLFAPGYDITKGLALIMIMQSISSSSCWTSASKSHDGSICSHKPEVTINLCSTRDAILAELLDNKTSWASYHFLKGFETATLLMRLAGHNNQQIVCVMQLTTVCPAHATQHRLPAVSYRCSGGSSTSPL